MLLGLLDLGLSQWNPSSMAVHQSAFSQKGDSPRKKLVESWQRKKGGKGEWLSSTVLKPREHAVLAGR